MKTWLLTLALLTGKAIVDGDTYQGHKITCDLPTTRHIRNTRGSNGMGLCVWDVARSHR